MTPSAPALRVRSHASSSLRGLRARCHARRGSRHVRGGRTRAAASRASHSGPPTRRTCSGDRASFHTQPREVLSEHRERRAEIEECGVRADTALLRDPDRQTTATFPPERDTRILTVRARGRRMLRSGFTEAQPVAVLHDGAAGENVRASRRRHGMSEKTHDRWQGSVPEADSHESEVRRHDDRVAPDRVRGMLASCARRAPGRYQKQVAWR